MFYSLFSTPGKLKMVEQKHKIFSELEKNELNTLTKSLNDNESSPNYRKCLPSSWTPEDGWRMD